VRPASRFHPRHQLLQTTVVFHVPRVVDDVEVENAASTVGDVAVTEVPTEQLAVGLSIQLSVVAERARDGRVRLTPGKAVALIEPPPAPNGLHRHAVLDGVVDVGHAGVGVAEG
jgi:hypothetical protein